MPRMRSRKFSATIDFDNHMEWMKNESSERGWESPRWGQGEQPVATRRRREGDHQHRFSGVGAEKIFSEWSSYSNIELSKESDEVKEDQSIELWIQLPNLLAELCNDCLFDGIVQVLGGDFIEEDSCTKA
ncbi:uncharacterized protein LOC116265785 [Nymphaea colorata]|uniref:uncharacterized protein LOC116265785 n=1 Tax=Nymphaea colorata TaxID=210225 RepID=UPI00129E1DAE|nr:uncharacterized protein LOC116265785 [Nymphaea colorata]